MCIKAKVVLFYRTSTSSNAAYKNMNKKFIKERLQNIKMLINSLRSKRMSDQEIYNELRYCYRYDEKRKIYNLITWTAAEELRGKYRILNNILIMVLAI